MSEVERDEQGNLIASYDPMEFLPEGHDVRLLVEMLRQQLQGAVDLLRDVADSGVRFEDPRVSYVEVQIDRETWEALRRRAA